MLSSVSTLSAPLKTQAAKMDVGLLNDCLLQRSPDDWTNVESAHDAPLPFDDAELAHGFLERAEQTDIVWLSNTVTNSELQSKLACKSQVRLLGNPTTWTPFASQVSKNFKLYLRV